jgi:kynureninase
MNNAHAVNTRWPTDFATAMALDAADPLARYRDEFHIPVNAGGEPLTYLCGHSLGLQPKRAAQLLNEELQVWQTRAVEGHFNHTRPWLSYHELLTPGLAELCGALPIEVVAMNSLSVNLHLLLTSFYRPNTQRHKILIEASAFPSDRYAVCSQLQLHGHDADISLIELKPRAGEDSLRTEDIVALLEREGQRIATVLQYLTGQLLDMPTITRVAQQQGCTVGIDLAHAIGNVPLQLHDWNIDFAVWCSYKYLNSGPGSIGGVFVHERHAHNFALPRLAGWWGHDKQSRFAMPQQFVPLPGAEGWQLSNPPIFACAPLLASLQIFQDAGITALREKSAQLTDYFVHLINTRLGKQITLITPTATEARGAMLSLRLRAQRDQARTIHEQLMQRGFSCDWREPDVIRATPAPLYNRHAEVWRFVDTLHDLLP